MPIYKRCSRCGKRIPAGSSCSCIKQRHKEYDKYLRDEKSKRFYHSNEWITARDKAMELDEGIDVYAYMTRGEILAADTVHHIIPLRDDWKKRVSSDNLISLSHSSHSAIEMLYTKEKEKIQQELKAMLSEYRNKKMK